MARLRVSGHCVRQGLDTQIHLSGSRAQGSAFFTKTPDDSAAGERPRSEKPRPGASLAGNAENNSGTICEGRAVQDVRCCATEFGLFLFSVERAPGGPSSPRVAALTGEFRQQPGGWELERRLYNLHGVGFQFWWNNQEELANGQLGPVWACAEKVLKLWAGPVKSEGAGVGPGRVYPFSGRVEAEGERKAARGTN